MRRFAISTVKFVNWMMRTMTAGTHFLQYALEWGWEPKPKWFDHFLNQHWQMSAKNSGLHVERGVFSRFLLKPNGRLLELCCGDGFNSRHFYSSAVRSVTAVDFDASAISHARRFNSAPNVDYQQRDIRSGLPEGPFDNIVWDAAMDYLTPAEIEKLLTEIVHLLGKTGIVSGYAVRERDDGRKSNAYQEFQFKDKDDLRRFLAPHFAHVKVWETIHPTRHNLYFAASQSPIEVM